MAVPKHALTIISAVILQENVKNVSITVWYVVIQQAALYVSLAMSL